MSSLPTPPTEPPAADRAPLGPPTPLTSPPTSPSPNPPSAAPPPRSTRGRRGIKAVAVAALALAAGGVGGFVAAERTDGGGSAASSQLEGDAEATDVGLHDQGADIAALVDSLQGSIVSIDTTVQRPRGPFGGGQGHGAGSGIVLDDGYIVTNAHVVAGASEVTVTPGRDAEPRPATIVGGDASADVAVLHVDDTSGLRPATLGSGDDIDVGEDVIAVGNALALEGGPSVTRGIVSAVDRSLDTANGTLTDLVQTDAAISSGNSGGPLVNTAGEVIGINTAVVQSNGTMTANNIGFAISIDKALDTVDDVIER